MRVGAPGAIVITKVVHGWRPAGLLAYLLGPGTAEVHRAPRVIASWDGLDAGWQPASTGPAEYDLALGPLITALHAPAFAAGLSTRAPAEHGKRGYVWHCSARVAATDRVLSDAQWAGIARELLDGAGIAGRGMRVARGGWRSGTRRTTSTSRRCWCARTPAVGSGRTTTTRSSALRRGRSSSALG